MTLATLRALLALAHGPAVERLTDRPPHAIARAYLPRWLEWTWAPGVGIDTDDRGPYANHVMLEAMHQNGMQRADLTDPGTVHAVKVALCLALGHDPGQHGTACAWRPLHNGIGLRERVGWYIDGTNGETYFVRAGHMTGDTDEIVSDVIAREEDPIKALVLACEHVIKEAP